MHQYIVRQSSFNSCRCLVVRTQNLCDCLGF